MKISFNGRGLVAVCLHCVVVLSGDDFAGLMISAHFSVLHL